MTISENDLLIHYDDQEQKVVIYSLFLEASSPNKRVLLTEYPLSKFKSMGINEAGRLLGENILIFLSGTRKELLEEEK